MSISMKLRILAICLLAAVLVMVYCIQAPKYHAAKILRELSIYDWGQHGAADNVRLLVQQYGGTVSCQPNLCQGEINVSNWLLNRLHLAPPTELRVIFDLHGNDVAQYALEYSERGSTKSIVWVIGINDLGLVSEPPLPFTIEKGPNKQGPSLFVRFTKEVSPSNKQLAFTLSVECLSQLGGCPQKGLAPKLWRIAEAEE